MGDLALGPGNVELLCTGSRFINKLHDVTSVLNPVEDLLARRGVFAVMVGNGVADRIGDFVLRPGQRFGAACRFGTGIGGIAVLDRLSGLGLHAEPGRSLSGLTMGADTGDAVGLGAVFGTVGAIGPRDEDETLTIKAVPIGLCPIDTTTFAIEFMRAATT